MSRSRRYKRRKRTLFFFFSFFLPSWPNFSTQTPVEEEETRLASFSSDIQNVVSIITVVVVDGEIESELKTAQGVHSKKGEPLRTEKEPVLSFSSFLFFPAELQRFSLFLPRRSLSFTRLFLFSFFRQLAGWLSCKA